MKTIKRSSGVIVLVLVIIITRTYSFTCLPSCICMGINITCSNQELSSIPEFDTINGANIVDLSVNEIEELEEFSWKGIEQLQFLYLNVNSIIYIQENAFSTFINLEYLDLSNNDLEYIPPNLFMENQRLTTLKLAGNLFASNVPIIASYSLENLDLSFSKLSLFTKEHIKLLPNIKRLNLQANNIVYINPQIFNKHPEISIVLSYNIWACNCSSVDVYNWARKNEDRIIIDDPIKCMNKNNIYIDMFNKSDSYLYKESCNIDEDSFGISSIKELSLVKENTTTPTIITGQSTSRNDDDDEYYRMAMFITVIVIILIVIIAIFAGVLLGLYISKYSLRMKRRHRRKSNCVRFLK